MTDTDVRPAHPMSALRRRALALGIVNATNYAVQFVLPVVLARFLLPESFGQYRLIWLVILTAMAFLPMEMPGVLYYFLPRVSVEERCRYILQTWLYLAVAGAIGALLVSHFNPWLPGGIRQLGEYRIFLPALLFLYAATLLLDSLPTIEERIGWQAAVTLSVSLLRALLLSGAAWATGDLDLMLWLMLLTLLLKAVMLMVYIARHHGLGGPWFGRRQFRKQVDHAAPFGIAEALYQLRSQADQWVAASSFALGQFAAFSIATVIGPLVNLCKRSVNHVFLPSMSRLHAADDLAGTIRMNSQANVMVSMLCYPMLAFTFVFAEELISLVYTSKYVAAASVMRIYALAQVLLLVELSSLTLLYREGTFVLRINAVLAFVSVALSWSAAQKFGLAGAALGSTAALYVDRLLTLKRIAYRTGIPVAQLQDWPRLARMLAAVSAAATAAWQLGSVAPTGGAIVPRLFIGGMALAAFYGALLYLSGDLVLGGSSFSTRNKRRQRT